MAVDPAMMAGLAPPQGLTNTQIGMPPQAGPPPPSQVPVDPSMGMPVDPSMGVVPEEPLPPEGMPGAPGAPVEEGTEAPIPSMLPTPVAKMLAEAINAVKMEQAKGMAEYLGDPRGSVRTNPIDLLRAWRKRNPEIDPLVEKIINNKSDEDIFQSMYPLRRPMIRYGRRTYTEQVEFAEYMNRLDNDERYASLDEASGEDYDEYDVPEADFPSTGEEPIDEDIREPEEDEEEE